MPIEIDSPNAPIIEHWRAVKKNNKLWLRHKLRFILTATDERFVPRILVTHGFFDSTSQVKKNQPDLWLEIPETLVMMQVELSWAIIEIWTEDI